MLKRLFKFGFFASLLMCSVASFAQEELMKLETKPKKELGAFDLWSDWTVGLNGGLTLPIDKVENADNSASYGFNLYFSKQLNSLWSVVFQGSMHDVGNGVGKSLATTLGCSFSIMDAIQGAEREAKWNVLALATIGLGFDKSGTLVQSFGNVYEMLNVGLRGSWMVSEHWMATIDAALYAPFGIRGAETGFKAMYSNISVGAVYKF